jgi:hypothetical protein
MARQDEIGELAAFVHPAPLFSRQMPQAAGVAPRGGGPVGLAGGPPAGAAGMDLSLRHFARLTGSAGSG